MTKQREGGKTMREDIHIVEEGFEGIPDDLTSGALLAANGLFAVRRLNLGQYPFIEVISKLGPGYVANGMKSFDGEGLNLYAPRIPRDELLKVEAFFLEVWQQFKGEAIVFLYYTPANGGMWRFVAIPQEVA